MTTATRALPCILAAAALAAPAAAQSFDGRVAFNAGHSIGAPLVTSPFPFNAPGTYDFAISLGAFDAQGFANQGMYGWIGSLSVSGPATLSLPALNSGNRPPFRMNPIGNGVVSPDGRTISGIDTARLPLVDLPWPEGDPMPPPPVFTQGNNQYFSAYRFQLTLNSFSPEPIIVTATGSMQAISEWVQYGGSEGGVVQYIGSRYVTDPMTTGSFSSFIPAPGAAALLGLGGLLASRRRRG